MDDFLGEPATNDSANFYRRMREQDPVYFNPRWGGWVLTSYDDVARGSVTTSGSRPTGWPVRGQGVHANGWRRLGVAALLLHRNFFAWMDPPDHTRFRRLLQETFTPKRSRRSTTSRPAGQRPDRGAAGGRALRLRRPVLVHLPVIVISEYLARRLMPATRFASGPTSSPTRFVVRAEDGCRPRTGMPWGRERSRVSLTSSNRS